MREVESSLLVRQILRSLALSSFAPDMREQLGLLVCDARLLRVQRFIGEHGLVLRLGTSPLVACPAASRAHHRVLSNPGPVERVTVGRCFIRIPIRSSASSVARRALMLWSIDFIMNVLSKLPVGFLQHVHRLSLGVEELLLLGGERVVVVSEDILLLFV